MDTEKNNNPEHSTTRSLPEQASDLNNLLQIISGTSALIENVWEGTAGSEKYFAMLHASVERAEKIAAELVEQAGGSRDNVTTPSLAAGRTKSKDVKPPAKARQRIMVVDDEEMALSLYEQILTEAGFEVVTAQSGFQCLDLFRRTPRGFKLVLLDLSMPLMDGEETFDRMRAMNGDLQVVLMTGFVEQEKLKRLRTHGLAGFLQKPKCAHEIVAYVRGIIHTMPFSSAARERPLAAAF